MNIGHNMVTADDHPVDISTDFIPVNVNIAANIKQKQP